MSIRAGTRTVRDCPAQEPASVRIMLENGGQTRETLACSERQGFLERGAATETNEAIVVQIPEGDLAGAEVSVCGVKGFLVDERRTFTAEDGSQETIDCAKVAALDIADSPVHVHGETVETYHILSGHGRMVLGNKVVPVGPGTLIVLPPGEEHGLAADDPEQPLRVLMTFAPGLAPVQHQQWRDEKILYARASERIAELTQ